MARTPREPDSETAPVPGEAISRMQRGARYVIRFERITWYRRRGLEEMVAEYLGENEPGGSMLVFSLRPLAGTMHLPERWLRFARLTNEPIRLPERKETTT